ncbi:efflux RND transporter periplasmic adaptor subunit [Petroclostridium sp. X23]|uniref:efflux RND transporter periplasmic adaptor subunit n=1 Tax=Petroclostridium sp. X23 TaxID=3045146 RepID=UPI0024AE17F1|nr:efflux RND transporter periplasmic adaptor subunit [Petroclostridium sp. X23]WHH57445.1 efflux RND transporter periplasmic adaptor subunit [Petroclostridium sp. X23]
MMNRKKGLIGIVIVLGVIAVAVAVSQTKAADARIETVTRGNMKEFIELRGKVELDKKEKVYSRLSGIIAQVKAKEGDQISADMPLAQLDVEDLDIAIDKAHAAYNAAKASLEELKNSIKPEQVRQAQAQLEQARIALEAAQKEYDYNSEKVKDMHVLYDKGGVSQQDLQDAQMLAVAAESVLNDAKQRVTIAETQLDILRKGVSADAVQAAEANAEQERLQIEELKNSLGKTHIYSPLEGRVLSKYVEPGMAVELGTPLYEVGDSNTAYIEVSVLTDNARKIQLGQKALISGEILDDHEITGKVYYIAPKAESTVSSLGVEQQRIKMKIAYDNNTVQLKPGYGVDVDIITQEKEDALYVPDKALFNLDGEDYVFSVTDSKLILQAVQTGIENDEYIEILQGLSEGQQIVIGPSNELKPGMKIKSK